MKMIDKIKSYFAPKIQSRIIQENFGELLYKKPYLHEIHKVQTEDGYILTMFRLNKIHEFDTEDRAYNYDGNYNIEGEPTKLNLIPPIIEDIEENLWQKSNDLPNNIKAWPLSATRRTHAVILQHGLFDSSDAWLVNKEEKALAFYLANRG